MRHHNLTFCVKINANLIALISYIYLRAKFGTERVEANKVILNKPNLPLFNDPLGPDGLPPLCYWSQQKTQKQIIAYAKN